MQINIDGLLMALFCLYAFSMPFELILEVLFEIDTIFKPFRIISLLIIGVYAIQVSTRGLYLSTKEDGDWFLYMVFAYGLLISCVRIIGGVFDMGLFYNDIFQTSLHLAVFFIFKNSAFTQTQALTIFRYFILGILVNGVYTFSIFFFKVKSGRQGGFIDNPNYAALGFVVAMAYILLKANYDRRIRYQFLYVLLFLFLLYIFMITGSRTGFIIFVLSSLIIFFFSSFTKKLMLATVIGLVALLLLPQQLEQASLGGPLIMPQRISQKLNSDIEDVRFIIWRGVFRTLEDRGYAGMGIGQFKAQFSKYYSDESEKMIMEMVNRGYFLSTHNDFLALLTDYGLPSLLLYAIFLFLAMRKILRRLIYPAEGEDAKFIAQLSFILFSCLILFGMAAENFQHQLFWFLLMFNTKTYLASD